MSENGTFEHILAEAGCGRATGRLADGRASIMLDVTGLDEAARAALEADVRAKLEPFGAVRIAQTSERIGRRLIAVASGKGGVGKSTLAANLAVALARGGEPVGLVDADIYGPSQPRLLDAEGVKPTAKNQVLSPVATRFGVPMLSMGQIAAPDQAIAWRGPMVAGALGQLVEADWGPARTLVVDLPPGTGDVQLTMIQKYKPAGAVIVSTPQDLALIDARRAIDLFRKAGVPILGLVENMAGYACPHCGEVAAAELGIACLGRADAGDPGGV